MSILTEIIKTEIAEARIIPFSRFMELALYCPDYGFYERENDTVGRCGDFYTSVSVGSLFGQLLAFQFAEWLAKMDGEKLQIVEAGAHDGKLAADILRWLKLYRANLFKRVEYVMAEPSARRRSWQRNNLVEFGRQVHWIETDLAQSSSSFRGVIFANELLDAMPVRRMGWDANLGKWFEWGVVWGGDRFCWGKIQTTVISDKLQSLPSELLAVLPDGFTTEDLPTAERWWATAAQKLAQGRLLTLDYGFLTEDFISPQRFNGTLRAYRQHKVCDNLLADPGQQDLTAHVDFSRIQFVGEACGLRTEGFVSQSEFLVGISKRFWVEAEQRSKWTVQQNREFQTLMHPA